MDEFQDRDITCKDCGKVFIFTVSGQRFFKEKGFTDPVRCKGCRINRKKQDQGGEQYQ